MAYYRPINVAPTQQRRDDRFFHPCPEPRRNAPVELRFAECYPRQHHCCRKSKIPPKNKPKPKHYLIRPVDGKRRGIWGRIKDALTWEGPDVFITSTSDRRTLMRDRPQRHQWSGWGLLPREREDRVGNIGCRYQVAMPLRETPWTLRHRCLKPHYNYRNRKYEPTWKVLAQMPEEVWTGLEWREDGKDSDRQPRSFRDRMGVWRTRVHLDDGAGAGQRLRRRAR